MLDSKKVIIGSVAAIATTVAVDATIRLVKVKDWLAVSRTMKKMAVAIESGALGGSNELVEEGREIIAKISTFAKGKNIKTLSTEDRAKLHLLREELERFYNAHCKA